MTNDLIYVTPKIDYWSAQELDNIEAKMSGGSGSTIGGVTQIIWTTPVNAYVYLNNVHSIQVANGIGLAAIAASLIPNPAIARALVIALGASSYIINFNNYGNGVVIYYVLMPGLIPTFTSYWIRSQ